jgi:hypothetical protein
MPSFVRPFVGRTLHKFGGVLGAQVRPVNQFWCLEKPYGIHMAFVLRAKINEIWLNVAFGGGFRTPGA